MARVHIFSNGTEWDMWEEGNCLKCRKHDSSDVVIWPTCEIESELTYALLSDGLIEQGIKDRMGYPHKFRCIEFEPI